MRDEYLSIQRQRGGEWVHPGLVAPPFPTGLNYLFDVVEYKDDKGVDHSGLAGWFGELASARTSSGFGGNPISYSEVKAWAELTGRKPSPLEVNALRRLDARYLMIMGRRDG